MITTQFFIDYWQAPVLLLGAGLAFHFGRKIYLNKKYHLKELKALNLFDTETKEVRNNQNGLKDQKTKKSIKVRWAGNKLIFSKYNKAFGKTDFENIKSNLEDLFSVKIDLISVKSQFFSSQPAVLLHCETFPEKYYLEEMPRLEYGQLFLGFDSPKEPVILEAHKEFENSLLIFGGKNSGKSTLINSIGLSFFKTLKNLKKENEYFFIIVDNKGSDYHELAEATSAIYLQPFRLDHLRQIVSVLEEYKKYILEVRAILNDLKVSPRHWDELKNVEQIKLKPKLFLICDEMRAYWSSERKNIKIPKEASQEEIEEKEKVDLQNKFGRLFDFLADEARACGVILIGASQSPLKTDYDYPSSFINFPTLVLGQTSQQVSNQLIGDNSLNDTTLTRGTFFIKDQFGARKFKAPLPNSFKSKGDL